MKHLIPLLLIACAPPEIPRVEMVDQTIQLGQGYSSAAYIPEVLEDMKGVSGIRMLLVTDEGRPVCEFGDDFCITRGQQRYLKGGQSHWAYEIGIKPATEDREKIALAHELIHVIGDVGDEFHDLSDQPNVFSASLDFAKYCWNRHALRALCGGLILCRHQTPNCK